MIKTLKISGIIGIIYIMINFLLAGISKILPFKIEFLDKVATNLELFFTWYESNPNIVIGTVTISVTTLVSIALIILAKAMNNNVLKKITIDNLMTKLTYAHKYKKDKTDILLQLRKLGIKEESISYEENN